MTIGDVLLVLVALASAAAFVWVLVEACRKADGKADQKTSYAARSTYSNGGPLAHGEPVRGSEGAGPLCGDRTQGGREGVRSGGQDA